MGISAKQAADDVFDRAQALLDEAPSVSSPLVADDLRRSALALGVAALDTYLHWALAKAPLKKMPSALKNLDVPFGELVELSEAMAASRTTIRPKVRVRHTLERVILAHTFQSSRGVGDAMQMLGTRKAFAKIETKINPAQKAQSIQDQLNRIVRRRNQVVHEGDMQRQSRPRRIAREPVDTAEVADDLTWLRGLVQAIDEVLA
ncbi:HEPN domain-containing protein [Curtobacterium citreum]|uniref:HEPN domain-containing protein n=1 Tax=Curtobacterium citreum TaxID=2036 RepID=A0ABT2HDM2_9MICO|nr:HEPN domain-containing protein [Curtobacterium citreum]MCS6521358.1 HEPN domain-containing protein [Curtobacterium citreum]